MCEEEAVNWHSKTNFYNIKNSTLSLRQGKVKGTNEEEGKTKEIQDDRGTGMDKKMELVECSRGEASHLWQQVTTDVP